MGIDAASREQDHAVSVDIAARILASLRGVEGDAASLLTPEVLAPLDQFEGRGVKATRDIAGLLQPQPRDHLLDIGGGIGGPARWIAARFGCHVTSLDLSPAFCRAAKDLNAVTGLSDRVQVVAASAADLPFAEGAFDCAYSQNVAMTIEDMRSFFMEAFRVLRAGGVLVFSQYGAGARGEPHYPLPWADGPADSFLYSTGETQAQVAAAGFELVWFHDRTREILLDLRESRRRLEEEDLPPLGLQTLLGERSREMQINVARSTEEGRLTFVEALVRKPAPGPLVQQMFPWVPETVPVAPPHDSSAAEWWTRGRRTGRSRHGPRRPRSRPFRRGGPTQPA